MSERFFVSGVLANVLDGIFGKGDPNAQRELQTMVKYRQLSPNVGPGLFSDAEQEAACNSHKWGKNPFRAVSVKSYSSNNKN